MTANPADAVREALLPCPFCGADDAHVIGIAATNERSGRGVGRSPEKVMVNPMNGACITR